MIGTTDRRSGIMAAMTLVGFLMLAAMPLSAAESAPSNARRPGNDEELQYWLENMVRHHRFTTAEVSGATGMSASEITQALARFDMFHRRPVRPSRSGGLVPPLLRRPEWGRARRGRAWSRGHPARRPRPGRGLRPGGQGPR